MHTYWVILFFGVVFLGFHSITAHLQAALCAMRIVERVPDVCEVFVRPAAHLLNDKKHGKCCMHVGQQTAMFQTLCSKGMSSRAWHKP